MLRFALFFVVAFSLLAASAQAATVAELIYDRTPVYKDPEGKLKSKVSNNLHSSSRARLLVLKRSDDGAWLRVRLPNRPNGNKGWIEASRVHLLETSYRVVVDRSERRLTLYRNNKVIASSGVVVGAPATPTPLGKFALWDRYRPSNNLRPWVLELTAHSEKLRRYEGGEGRVALHGMRGSLQVPLGSAASHGCVRLPDRMINLLARRLSLGTPITIVR